MDHLYDRLSLFRRRQDGERRRSPILPEKSKVARVLFGPPDHEENMRFVRRELAKGQREASERWNFDFVNEKPIPGRYEWLSPEKDHSEVECGKSLSYETSGKEPDGEGENRNPSSSTVSEKGDLREKRATCDRHQENSSSIVTLSQGTTKGERLAHPTGLDCCGPAPAQPCDTPLVSGSKSSQKRSDVDVGPRCSNASTSSRFTLEMSKESSTNSSPSRPSQRQSRITGHFPQRKRSKSKSKIKTQERKQGSENLEYDSMVFQQKTT